MDYAYIDARSDVDIPGNGRDVLMPMGSVSIPLNKGRYNAIRQEEIIQKQAIEAQRSEIANNYESEIEMAFSVIEYSDQVEVKFSESKGNYVRDIEIDANGVCFGRYEI